MKHELRRPLAAYRLRRELRDIEAQAGAAERSGVDGAADDILTRGMAVYGDLVALAHPRVCIDDVPGVRLFVSPYGHTLNRRAAR